MHLLRRTLPYAFWAVVGLVWEASEWFAGI